MSTVTEALDDATAAMTSAVADVRGVLSEMRALKDATTGQATTIIQTFVARPPLATIYCDPLNGSDANDGSNVTVPKRDLDAILDGIGNNATTIILLSDATIRRRRGLYAPLNIAGSQRSGNGTINFRRTITFLGSAENSPVNDTSFCSGFFCYGPGLTTTFIDFRLPDVPNGLTYRSHLTSMIHTSFSLSSPTITVGSAQAGALIGSNLGRATVFADPVLGMGAAGHLFEGIPANTNPNAVWNYSTNITSA